METSAYMTDDEINRAFGILEDYDYLSEETIRCVTGIYGWSQETLENIIWWLAAARDWAQFCEMEGINL